MESLYSLFVELSPMFMLIPASIHAAHDEAKDKEFELEITWVCEESKGRHQFVPKNIVDEAERLAKESSNDEMEDD